MDVHDYLRVLRRTLRLIVVLAVVGALLGAAVGLLQERRYTATARAFVSVSSASTLADLDTGAAFAQQAAQAYAGVATTTYVLRPVIARLDLPGTPAALAERVDATVAADSSMVSIAVTDGSAGRAARTANEIVRQLRTAALDLTPPTRTGTGATAVSTASVALTSVDPAVAGSAPVGPTPLLAALLGALAGAVLAFVVGLLRELLDTRVRTAQDVRRVTEAPLLGTTVRDPRVARQPLVVDVAATSARAEGFRTLRTNLRFLEVDGAPGSLVITSSVEGEGKSVTAANVALAIAALGRRVLLVDADLRRPRVAQVFGVEGAIGLSDVLVGAVELQDAVQTFGATGLRLLPAGSLPPNPNELLQSGRMGDLMQRLHAEYEMVLFDTPPLLAVTDAVVLGRQAGSVVVVAASGKVRRPQLADALAVLAHGGVRVAGLVLTLVPRTAADAQVYGYGASEVPVAAEPVEPKRRRAPRRGRKQAQPVVAQTDGASSDAAEQGDAAVVAPVGVSMLPAPLTAVVDPPTVEAGEPDVPAPVPALRHFVRPVLWNESLVPVRVEQDPAPLHAVEAVPQLDAAAAGTPEVAVPTRARHRRTWLPRAVAVDADDAARRDEDAAAIEPPALAPVQLSLLPSGYEPEPEEPEDHLQPEPEPEPESEPQPESEVDEQPDFESLLGASSDPSERTARTPRVKQRRERAARRSSSAKPVRIPPPPQLAARLQEQQGGAW